MLIELSGSRFPPFNNQEIAAREALRDKQINPTKYKRAAEAYQKDLEGVAQRRRDRYMQFYVEKEEEEKLRQAQAAQAVACQ